MERSSFLNLKKPKESKGTQFNHQHGFDESGIISYIETNLLVGKFEESSGLRSTSDCSNAASCTQPWTICLSNWMFQMSKNGVNHVTMLTHTNDKRLAEPGSTCT